MEKKLDFTQYLTDFVIILYLLTVVNRPMTLTCFCARLRLRKYMSSASEQILTQPLWRMILHLINHQTQHCSEIAMHLTALSHSPGEPGMSVFFNADWLLA